MKLDSVFISSYTFIRDSIRTNTAGPLVPMLNFFKKCVKVIYLIEQPLPNGDSLDVQFTIFEGEKKNEERKINFFFSRLPFNKQDSTKTYIRLKLRDICANFYFLCKYYKKVNRKKLDLFIGVECINAIFGIFLKKIGLVNKVVYYIFDWAPDRYSNPIMNSTYIFLDKIATYYADYTWNITYTIAEAKRDILNYAADSMSQQLYVPYCVDFDIDKISSDDDIDTNLIIYSGGLIEENGPQILLRAYRFVVEKFPNSKLLIIGSGKIMGELKDFVIKNDLERKVEFTGYISDENKIIALQCKGAIGVAPYPIINGSRKPYGDVIKIRMYLACGLVVVTTPIPPVSKEIYEEKLGIRTKDDTAEEIAKAICLLLTNKELLFQYRKNVIEKAKLSSWEKNYTNALANMGFVN